MLELLKSPILLGGIIPMIGFGMYNYLWKEVSAQLSISEIFLSISFICLVIATFSTLFFDSAVSQTFTSINWWKAVIINLLWVSAILGLIFGFRLGGSASVMLPIVSAGVLVSTSMAFFYGDEKITWNILIGTCFIIAGASLVVWKN